MPVEPTNKRVIAFFDGQNLFHNAYEAFGYNYPNFDAKALVMRIAAEHQWAIAGIRFYTGIADSIRDPFWNHFWTAKLANMGRQGIVRFTRPLRYRKETVTLDDGTTGTVLVKQEKGIDVRIALDIVRLALDGKYDVALLFSQDQDLSEAAYEVKAISVLQNRWMQVASAFPVGPGTTNKRGIDRTKWLEIDQYLYDSCVDPADYRPKRR